MNCIRYRDGYRYQLANTYQVKTGVFPGRDLHSEYVHLSMEGLLTISYGYAWDGPSGPTFDTKSTLRGSLVHDALYQLIRLGLLPASFRLRADQVAYRIWREDGMNPARAWLWRFALNKFAAPAARVGDKMVLVAP